MTHTRPTIQCHLKAPCGYWFQGGRLVADKDQKPITSARHTWLDTHRMFRGKKARRDALRVARRIVFRLGVEVGFFERDIAHMEAGGIEWVVEEDTK